MHTIEKKKEIIPVIIPVTEFRSWERRKLHFRESNFTNFPREACPRTPQEFVPAARTALVRQLNHCMRYFQMLPKTLLFTFTWQLEILATALITGYY